MHDVVSRFSILFPDNLITKEQNILVKGVNLLRALNIQMAFHLNFQLEKLFFSKNYGKFKKSVKQLANLLILDLSFHLQIWM